MSGFDPRLEMEQAREELRGLVADLDLTEHEQRIVRWIEGWDLDVVRGVTGVLAKAKASAEPTA